MNKLLILSLCTVAMFVSPVFAADSGNEINLQGLQNNTDIYGTINSWYNGIQQDVSGFINTENIQEQLGNYLNTSDIESKVNSTLQNMNIQSYLNDLWNQNIQPALNNLNIQSITNNPNIQSFLNSLKLNMPQK